MRSADSAQGEPAIRRDWVALIGCLALVVWAHHRVLDAFFSPDDLVHLEQATGLRPTAPTPFRVLSQVLYFRAMVPVFGLDTVPYHVVTLLIHLANVALVFHYARRCGVDRPVSACGAALFGSFPLFNAPLSSAVGVNDGLALAFTLIALLLLQRPGWSPAVSAAICFGLGLLSKESVIAMPVLALIGRPRGVDLRRQLVRVAPMAGVAVVFAALFAFLPPAELGGTYAMAFRSNLFHNAMTYLSWSIDLWRPLPDLVSSFDAGAWRLGLPIAAVLVLALIITRGRDVAIVLGTMWWLVGILPVLALITQTYRHYMYTSQPGFAIAAAAIVIGTARASLRIAGLAPESAARAAGACAGVVAVLYAWQAGRLIDARLAERVEGTALALDPIVRRREVAQNAIRSLRAALGPQSARLAILMYGPRTILGARSGKQYTETAGARPYSLLEASTDNGRTIRLFFPQVDTVAFLDRWEPEYDDFLMVVPVDRDNLQLVGRGPEAHLLLSRWLLDNKDYRAAAEHLRSVLEQYPEDADLRMSYADALASLGEEAESTRQLEEVVRTASASATRTAAENQLRRATPTPR